MFLVQLCVLSLFARHGMAALDWRQHNGVSLRNETEVKHAFSEWKAFFNKTYPNKKAESKRYQIFKENWDKILEFNSKNKDVTLALNQFGDFTMEEFSRYAHGSKVSGKRSYWKESSHSQKTNPASVDWRTKGVVTAVKNQGECGSCWSFSTTGSIECRSAIATGKLISLSEQQLMDCSWRYGNTGCDGGYMDLAFRYVEANGGLCTEDKYPYEDKDGICRSNSCGTAYDSITGFGLVAHDNSTDLETAVTKGCVSVSVNADGLVWAFYRAGVVSSECPSQRPLDHAVLAVGYGEENGKKYWLIKNSWGTIWGDKGYIKLCKECNKNDGDGECGVLIVPTFPIV